MKHFRKPISRRRMKKFRKRLLEVIEWFERRVRLYRERDRMEEAIMDHARKHSHPPKYRA